MQRILVSACLLGEMVRYDGKGKLVSDERLRIWVGEGRTVAICPELSGGLLVPRAPAERIGPNVIDNSGAEIVNFAGVTPQMGGEFAGLRVQPHAQHRMVLALGGAQHVKKRHACIVRSTLRLRGIGVSPRAPQ